MWWTERRWRREVAARRAMAECGVGHIEMWKAESRTDRRAVTDAPYPGKCGGWCGGSSEA